MTFRDFSEVRSAALGLWTFIQSGKMTVSGWELEQPLDFDAEKKKQNFC